MDNMCKIRELKGKVEELKEIIVNLKLELVEAHIPMGYCPYSYTHYKSAFNRDIDCNEISCNKCRELFMQDIEKEIRKEVENI